MDSCLCSAGFAVGWAEGEAIIEAEEDRDDGLMTGFTVGLIVGLTEGFGVVSTPFTSAPEGDGDGVLVGYSSTLVMRSTAQLPHFISGGRVGFGSPYPHPRSLHQS